jgi:pyruvate dehydrogenase E2 component (dihydrolipoamide acetyltransferase)
MIDFKLPSLGADMDEGTLLEWHVAPGQAVKKGDIIAVFDTSKAAIDIEVWQPGTVHELLVQPGQKIPVGTVIARLLEPGEPPQRQAPAAPAHEEARQRVTPAARRRAAELGVALTTMTGSGPDGALTLADVEHAAARPGGPPPSPAPSPPADRAAEMRKVIAAAMARSKREIPHYHLAEPVAMRQALDWLRAHNANAPVTERLLSAVLLIKAVALALREVPELNGVFADGAFRAAPQAHVGVAISLRGGGLVAPALHDVADKPLPQLMAELADLVARARAFRLRSSELSDATVTVTNLGDTGVELVHGVIYPPQVALVGFGRIADRPAVEAGQVVALPMLTATLAADHRVSDGHRGAIFLARLRELLQHPELL